MESKVLKSNEVNWQEWDALVDAAEISSIYHKSYFLRNLDGELNLILLFSKNIIIGGFPIFIKKKLGIKYSLQPIECKYLGPVLDVNSSQNTFYIYNQVKEILQKLLLAFPKNLDAIILNCTPDLNYLLPFHWEGFNLIYKNTFILNLSSGYENNFAQHLKQELKEFPFQDYLVSFNKLLEADAVKFIFNQITTVPKSVSNNLTRILEGAKSQDELLISEIFLDSELIGCCVFLLFKSKKKAYFTYSNFLKKDGIKNPLPYLSYKSLEYLKENSILEVDFTGLMNKGYEGFWRKFGLIPKPYVQIKKFRNKFIPLILNK